MKGYRFFGLLMLCLVWFSSLAIAEVYQSVRYVKMDFNGNTAYMYDENFQKFPDGPLRGSSYESFEGRSVWLLASESHVVLRAADGAVTNMDEVLPYAKINHHMVFAYDGKPSLDLAPGGQRPIGIGSELNSFELPFPYAYKMEGGVLYGWNWHFHNVGGLPRDEEVYLQIIITFDNADRGYKDTNVTWVDTVPVQAEFCVSPGNNAYDGLLHYPWSQRTRPVAVVPHIHDHGYLLELVKDGEVVISFEPTLVNDYTYHINHFNGQCATNVFWHRHDGHIQTKSLQTWTWDAATDLIFERGSSVWVRSYYDNPHTNFEGQPISIDGMGILMTFWEAVP